MNRLVVVAVVFLGLALSSCNGDVEMTFSAISGTRNYLTSNYSLDNSPPLHTISNVSSRMFPLNMLQFGRDIPEFLDEDTILVQNRNSVSIFDISNGQMKELSAFDDIQNHLIIDNYVALWNLNEDVILVDKKGDRLGLVTNIGKLNPAAISNRNSNQPSLFDISINPLDRIYYYQNNDHKILFSTFGRYDQKELTLAEPGLQLVSGSVEKAQVFLKGKNGKIWRFDHSTNALQGFGSLPGEVVMICSLGKAVYLITTYTGRMRGLALQAEDQFVYVDGKIANMRALKTRIYGRELYYFD